MEHVQAGGLPRGLHVIDPGPMDSQRPDDLQCCDCGQWHRPHLMSRLPYEVAHKHTSNGQVHLDYSWRCPGCHERAWTKARY